MISRKCLTCYVYVLYSLHNIMYINTHTSKNKYLLLCTISVHVCRKTLNNLNRFKESIQFYVQYETHPLTLVHAKCSCTVYNLERKITLLNIKE